MAEIGGVSGPRKVWFCRVTHQAAKQRRWVSIPPRSGFLGFSGLSQWTDRWASSLEEIGERRTLGEMYVQEGFLGEESLGEKSVQEEFLGEESLGEKYMSEKYVQGEFLGEKYMSEQYVHEEILGEESLGEKYMGEKYVQEEFLGEKSV